MRRLFPVLLLLAPPAAAQTGPVESVSVPAGCEPLLSVLDASCYWTHRMTCEGDPPGSLRQVILTAEGVTATLSDADGQLLESFDSLDGTPWRLSEAIRPVSLATLLAEGSQDFEFLMEGDGRVIRVQGEERLTGETAVLDGLTVQVVDFAYEVTEATGEPWYAVSGRQFVSVDPPAYYPGTEDYGDGSPVRDITPTDLVAPGEPGFLSAWSPEECLAALPAAGPAKPGPAK